MTLMDTTVMHHCSNSSNREGAQIHCCVFIMGLLKIQVLQSGETVSVVLE